MMDERCSFRKSPKHNSLCNTMQALSTNIVLKCRQIIYTLKPIGNLSSLSHSLSSFPFVGNENRGILPSSFSLAGSERSSRDERESCSLCRECII